MHSTDVLIIGAGPIGLYGAYCAGFRGLSTTVVDVLPEVGGQVMTLYPEKEIRDVAGLPLVKGREFVAGLREQADAYSPTYLLSRQAVSIQPEASGPVLVGLDDGTLVRAGAVVISSGIGTPVPRPLPVGEEWLGRGLSYLVGDLELYGDAHVVVVGGGDSALDWADAVAPLARSVTLVHRRGMFRGHAGTLERVCARGVTLHTNTEVAALEGDLDAGRLRRVRLRHTDGAESSTEADQVIAALGFISDLGPIRDWGLDMAGRTISTDRAGRTSLARVYAAGDAAGHEGKVALMSVGFGEVATAINHIAVELDPALGLFPGHSTDDSEAAAGLARKA